jgi:glucokinase
MNVPAVPAPVVAGIDIGGTKIAVGLIDAKGRILKQAQTPTAPEHGYPAALERVSAVLRSLLTETKLSIGGIGVGSAGPIDSETGVYGEVGTLPGWQGAALAADLEQRFGVRAMVENDADAGAMGEATWGAGHGSRSLIYVTVSTGIGAGVVLDGRLYRGAGGAHPEIGHFVLDASVDASVPVCYCGVRGCWESLASGTALETWFASQTNEVVAATEICERARQGDGAAQKAVGREVHYLGLGLSNLVTIFGPHIIVLGGGMMQSADLLFAPALDVVKRTVTQVPVGNTSIVPAGLGGNTGLLGAASVWFYRVKQDGQYTGSVKVS